METLEKDTAVKKIKPRRPYMGSMAKYEEPPITMESNRDFVLNNVEVCVAFLERELEKV
jgi:hypothetical protein